MWWKPNRSTVSREGWTSAKSGVFKALLHEPDVYKYKYKYRLQVQIVMGQKRQPSATACTAIERQTDSLQLDTPMRQSISVSPCVR